MGQISAKNRKCIFSFVKMILLAQLFAIGKTAIAHARLYIFFFHSFCSRLMDFHTRFLHPLSYCLTRLARLFVCCSFLRIFCIFLNWKTAKFWNLKQLEAEENQKFLWSKNSCFNSFFNCFFDSFGNQTFVNSTYFLAQLMLQQRLGGIIQEGITEGQRFALSSDLWRCASVSPRCDLLIVLKPQPDELLSKELVLWVYDIVSCHF